VRIDQQHLKGTIFHKSLQPFAYTQPPIHVRQAVAKRNFPWIATETPRQLQEPGKSCRSSLWGAFTATLCLLKLFLWWSEALPQPAFTYCEQERMKLPPGACLAFSWSLIDNSLKYAQHKSPSAQSVLAAGQHGGNQAKKAGCDGHLQK